MLERLYQRYHTWTKPKTWYQQDDGLRLSQDREQLATTFPNLSFCIDKQRGHVFLEGTITLEAECGIPTPIQVRVEFPEDYPDHEPRIYDAASRFPHDADRHFYADGRCCLWLPAESRWNKKDPDGLCHFLEEAAIFFDQQLIYDAMGKRKWPGRQRSHGDMGYVEFVQELLGGDTHLLDVFAPMLANRSSVKRNSRCPCGSGIKYKRCHLSVVEEISRRVGTVKLYKIFGQWSKSIKNVR